MPFSPRVERWRPSVSAIVDPNWINIVLAIIAHESSGVPGIPGHRKTKSVAKIATDSGGQKLLNRAWGLMQTIPGVIASYNSRHSPPATFERISGKSERDGRVQIKIGWDLLKRFQQSVRQIVPHIRPQIGGSLNVEFVKFVLAAYAYGPGNLRKKTEALESVGKTVSWQNLNTAYPKWGWPHNRPIQYANWVVAKTGFRPEERPGDLPVIPILIAILALSS